MRIFLIFKSLIGLNNQKEQLIELLRKVCRVSGETVRILREMEE